MPAKIPCPNPECDAVYRVSDEKLGRMGRCKKCGTDFPLIPLTIVGEPTPEGGFPTIGSPTARQNDMPAQFGRYKIIRSLGIGGMGSVWLVQDTKLRRSVALKVPHGEFAQHPKIRARFLREARAAAMFHHPNFCPIYDVDEVDGRPYLTMPFYERGSLASKIQRDVPWEPRKAAEVIRQLAAALAKAHDKGVVHRDLKPDNVMVDSEGTWIIMDFGLAQGIEEEEVRSRITVAGHPMGTPAYMPPEQANGDLEAIGPHSDIYTLGVIFYELLTGRLPFLGNLFRLIHLINTADPPAPSSCSDKVDARLDSICLKAMAKKPEDRHASMAEFAKVLQEWLNASEPAAEIPAVVPIEALLQEWISTSEPALPRPSPRPDPVPLVPSPRPDPVPLVPSPRPDPVPLVPSPRPDPVPLVPSPRPANLKKASPASPRPDETEITNSLGMKLRLIPAGEFPMGAPDGELEAEADEKPRHRVRITRSFYLGVHAVTQAEYRNVMGVNPSYFSALGEGKAKVAGMDTARHPVEQVSWNDAVAFCNKLGERERLRPCYGPGGEWNAGVVGYRLPTEAEWEYACRAGTSKAFACGDRLSPDYANFNRKSTYNGSSKGAYLERTTPVGSFQPNAFGLFDMHGNVWEWCWDFYDGSYYKRLAGEYPLGGPQALYRVIRGGSWYSSPRDCRSAYRGNNTPVNRHNYLGFRVARVWSVGIEQMPQLKAAEPRADVDGADQSAAPGSTYRSGRRIIVGRSSWLFALFAGSDDQAITGRELRPAYPAGSRIGCDE